MSSVDLPARLSAADVATSMRRLAQRGDPDASVVVPVNARGDLDNVRDLMSDLARYAGSHALEVVLVVNNYDPDRPPPAIEELEGYGVTVLAIPTLERPPGVAIPLAARVPGVERAASDRIILFDSDVRVPDATALLDWYVAELSAGAGVAYSHVAFFDVRPLRSVRVKIAIHHASRWLKRVVLRIPTTRGSNYAVDRPLFLALFRGGVAADDLNVGPGARAAGRRVAYSGRRAHTVYTSARMFRGGWRKLLTYNWYRLRYNLRVLPVRPDAASRTGREADPADRFDYTARDRSRDEE